MIKKSHVPEVFQTDKGREFSFEEYQVHFTGRTARAPRVLQLLCWKQTRAGAARVCPSSCDTHTSFRWAGGGRGARGPGPSAWRWLFPRCASGLSIKVSNKFRPRLTFRGRRLRAFFFCPEYSEIQGVGGAVEIYLGPSVLSVLSSWLSSFLPRAPFSLMSTLPPALCVYTRAARARSICCAGLQLSAGLCADFFALSRDWLRASQFFNYVCSNGNCFISFVWEHSVTMLSMRIFVEEILLFVRVWRNSFVCAVDCHRCGLCFWIIPISKYGRRELFSVLLAGWSFVFRR